MAIVFILCRCEMVIFALGIIYSVCLKHKCQTLNILVIFLSSGEELLGVVMSVGRSVRRSLENFDNF